MTIKKIIFLILLSIPIFACTGVAVKSDVAVTEKINKNTILKSKNQPIREASEQMIFVDKAILLINKGDFDQAVKEISKALKFDPSKSYVQFIAGLAYHLKGLSGDGEAMGLAEQGYKMAIKFDQTNWMARYQLGLLYLDRKKYKAAQIQLANALLFNARDLDMLYHTGVASYYAQDPSTAVAVFSRLLEIEPTNKKALEGLTIASAAVNDPDKATAALQKFQSLNQAKNNSERLSLRMNDWKRFYKIYGDKALPEKEQSMDLLATNSKKNVVKQTGQLDDQEDSEQEEQSDDNNQDDSNSEAEENTNRMVIVDAVIIRTEEDVSTRKGVNLLSGLQVQYGNSDDDSGYSETRYSGPSDDDDSVIANTKAITQYISIPGISYSLNIFNSFNDRNEVLARPSIVATSGEQSTFFSGTHISAQIAYSGNGDAPDAIDADIGVTLSVTPEFLPDGRIKLQVESKREFIKEPSSNVTFANILQTTTTEITASVVLSPGETLLLGGLSEKETEIIRDGVPILQDIPIIQYFFSKEISREFLKSVLIMITPRVPQYIYHDDEKDTIKNNGYSESDRVISELQSRYSDWFRPYPNWASVFSHMQMNSLYREFRTGDVSLERWDTMGNVKNRLERAYEFLYF